MTVPIVRHPRDSGRRTTLPAPKQGGAKAQEVPNGAQGATDSGARPDCGVAPVRFRCFVPGKPETQGSARAFVVKGRAVVTSDNKRLKQWRQTMHSAFYRERDEVHDPEPLGAGTLFAVPVCVTAEMIFPRLKGHPKTERGRAPGLPPLDLDKLMRAVGDALTTSDVLSDDRIIAQWVASKRYADIGEDPGVLVEVTPI